MSAASRHRRAEALVTRVVQAGFVVGLVALWHLATTRWGVSPFLLPQPAAVLRELLDVLATGEFVGDLKVTLYELAVAFTAATVSGTVIGYFLSRSGF